MDEFNPNAQVSPDAMANDPAAVYEAPGLEGIPSEQGVEEQPDYAAMLEQERQARQQAEQREAAAQQQAQALHQQQQQVLYAQAQQAWNNREAELVNKIQDYDQNTQMQIMREFYKQRDQEKDQQFQQVLQFVTAQSWAEKVMQENGLTPEDRILLGQDPNAMPQIAARIKAERDQHRKLVEQIERDRRAMQAQQSVQAGVNRIGGVGGRPVQSQTEYELGSPEHLRALRSDPSTLVRVGGRRTG
jgi:hypothetical protein